MIRILLMFGVALVLRADQPVTAVVEDPSGAPVANAKVSLTAKQGGEPRKGVTGRDGKFVFDRVADGVWHIAVEAKSLAPGKKQVVVAGAPVDIKIALDVQAKADEVTITTASGKVAEEAVSPDRNADRLNFEDGTLASLPAPGNDALAVVSAFLSPAAQGSEGVSITVDGIESSAATLPASAIRRIRLNRNPYSVQFRRPGKARVEVLSEEGSVRRHRGAIGISVRNSVFDARNALAAERPDRSQTLIDFNLAGPVRRNRSSFYVNGEHYANNETATVNARTPEGNLIQNVPTPERRTRFIGRLENKGEVHQTVATWSFFDQSQQNRGSGGLKLREQGTPSSESSHRILLSDRALLFNKLLNDIRVSVTRENVDRGIVATAPEIDVHGAFTGGPSQTFRSRRETSARVHDIVGVTIGRHSLKFGAEIRPAFFRSTERQNFGGTYEFASLASFALGQPLFYRVSQGDPAVSLRQHEVAAFVQDEVALAKGLSLTYGVRYQWQSDVNDRNNLDPRVGFAFAPGGGKTVLRGGAGVFHERVTEDVQRRSLLFDGVRLIESVIFNPGYPYTPGSQSALRVLPNVVRTLPSLIAPTLMQASIGIERELWKRTTLAVEYQHLRGEHLLRTRNVNAPVDGVRPDPLVRNISLVESSASMRSNAMTVTLRSAWKRWLTTTAQYTLSRTEDDTSGPFEQPANPYDLHPEWGRADYDSRHRLQVATMLSPSEGYRIGLIVSASSGIPFNITTGNDENGDSVTNDRPVGIGRNTGIGPGLARFDLRFTRMLHAPRLLDRGGRHTSRNMELSIDAFNLLNHTNYSSYVGVLTSPFFGRSSVALPARTLQISLRYRL